MSGLEAIKEYCAKCAHKEKCWKPCPTVLLAIQEDRT